MSASHNKPRFEFESQLVQALISLLDGGSLDKALTALSCEFDYKGGKTDVVAVCQEKDVHAFEAKLKNWKVALHQARRNTCYAHYSYVVLPGDEKTGLKKAIDFKRHGVGLIIIDANSTLSVAVQPQKHEPLMPWVTSKALAFTESSDVSLNAHTTTRRRKGGSRERLQRV